MSRKKQEDKNQSWGHNQPKNGNGNFQDYEKKKSRDKNKTRMNSEQAKMKKDFKRDTSNSRTEVNLVSPDSILCMEI